MLAAKLVIGDGDALQVAGAGLDHEARQGAGVDAAGEEDADRDIGDQVAGDGFAQGLADVFADLGRGRDRGAVGLAPGVADILPAALAGDLAVLDPQAVAGGDGLDVAIPDRRPRDAAQQPEAGLAA